MPRFLRNSQGIWFILWCMLASFGAYFCMYAFRKPFNTGLYEDYALWGLNYKTILIFSQVAGYMLSKLLGIKIISELKPSHRIPLILGLILFAEMALLGFGLVPFPYNFLFLFLNGLPLGMVWGVIFSFLEGRRVTELISVGLSISLIVASGILKTIYLEVYNIFPALSEFWMPFTIGIFFLPLFFLFVWMLSVIPAPSAEDIRLRKERQPMSKKDKKRVIRAYGPGLICIVLTYAFLTTLRDFRDNFSVEIWNEISFSYNSSVFAKTELFSGVVVLLAVGGISLFKHNIKAFHTSLLLIGLGILLCSISTFLFNQVLISPYFWMLSLGSGLFLAYILIQTALFERMIATYGIHSNAGFFVYICDSVGYLGSIGLLLYKEFFYSEIRWSVVLVNFIYLTSISGLILLLAVWLFFSEKPAAIADQHSAREALKTYS